MEDQKKSLETLHEIRQLMERSTRFVSLSGLSGLFIGLYALVASGYLIGLSDFRTNGLDWFVETNQTHVVFHVLVITLFLSLLTGFLLTYRKAGTLRWDSPTRRLVFHLGTPLVTGGILCFIFESHGYWEFILPTTLIFYGLALLNASKYTWEDLQYMGLGVLVAGLLAFLWPSYALYCWAFGFGLLHILYGLSIHLKYEK